MSIDERLRRGLSADVVPAEHRDLDVRAGRVIERGRRRRNLRRTGTAIVVLAVAGIAIATPRLLGADGARPARQPTAPPKDRAPSPLIGTFRLIVRPGAPGAAAVGAVGRWVLVIDAARQASLTRVGDPRVQSGAFIAPESITLRVLGCGAGAGRYSWGLYGKGAGHYSWGFYDTTIRFAVVDDPCALRSYLLHGPGRGHAWRVVAGT